MMTIYLQRVGACKELKQYMYAHTHMEYLHVRVVNRHGRTKVGYLVFVALIKHFKAKLCHFFASCNFFIHDCTGHSLRCLYAQVSKSSDFCTDNVHDNDDDTDTN